MQAFWPLDLAGACPRRAAALLPSSFRKVQGRGIAVPDDLQAFLLLRRASLSPEDRKLTLATTGGELDLAEFEQLLATLGEGSRRNSEWIPRP